MLAQVNYDQSKLLRQARSKEILSWVQWTAKHRGSVSASYRAVRVLNLVSALLKMTMMIM